MFYRIFHIVVQPEKTDVIRGLLNVKWAGFQLYLRQDQTQQYNNKNVQNLGRDGVAYRRMIIDCNCKRM